MDGHQLTICVVARSNQNGQSPWELQRVGLATLVKFAGTVTFQCSARPFETLWIFTENEWAPADHMCSCKKQSERPKSLRVAVGWPCASSLSIKSVQNSLVQHADNVKVWVQYFNAVRAPLNHSEYLQGMNGDQLTICAVARSNQNGQSCWELQ